MEVVYVKNNKLVKAPLPEWLNEEAYLFNKSEFMLVWSMGFPLDIPCGLILRFDYMQVYNICQLYNAKTIRMKSNFRKSLKQQLHRWFESNPEDDRWFETPFSTAQWARLNTKKTQSVAYNKLKDIKKAIIASSVNPDS
jgi:hypothetical protein